MGLSWTSFILESINFLVLVWILKRLFYLPIQKIILQRKLAVQDNLDKAQKLHDAAEKLQEKYENRLQDWEIEKSEKKIVFQQELDEWKSKELERFQKKLEEEKDKMYSREKQKLEEIVDKNSKESFLLAGKFATKFLTSLVDVDLDNKIVDKVISDISQFSEERREMLKNNYQQQEIEIASAFKLNEQQRKELTETLRKILNQEVEISFSENPDLLAGLTIKVGSVLLQANLKDELKFFTEITHEYS